MIPAHFHYHAPSTVDEALSILAAHGEDAKVLGGGQSLLPLLRMRLAAPQAVVDIGRIPELRGVSEEGDALVIGAMTTHYDVRRDPLVGRHAQLVALATATVADPQVRHLGTFGGALAHADPAGDLPAVAVALEAEMVIAGQSGRRTVPASEFFVDYFTTVLDPAELLVSVRLPKRTGWGAHYEKFQRTAQAWAIVGVAAAVRVEAGSIAEARVGLTNMGPTPVRAVGVERALVGRPATAEEVREAAQHATEGTHPASDGNADVEYREQLARVLTGRAVLAAAGS